MPQLLVKDGMFRLAYPDLIFGRPGKIRWPAKLIGYLAVHERRGGPGYAVSHRATGRQILLAKDEASGIWLARRLQELSARWDSCTMTELEAHRVELAAAVKQARREWRKRDAARR